jgi:hypothetical protein
VAQPSTYAPQIICDTNTPRAFLHDMPNRLFRDALSPCLSNLVHPADQPSSINCGCSKPIIQLSAHQSGTGIVRTWPPFADQINNGPVLLALLRMTQSPSHGFVPPQPTREQQCEQGSVAFSFQTLTIWYLPKRVALLRAVNQFPRRIPSFSPL